MPMDKNEQPDNSSASKKAEQESSRPEKMKKKAETKQRGEYKVVFKGRLRDGFSKEQVVANIVRLTKIPESTIQKKFFSGKAVIIRRAHDEAHAQKLQHLFVNAGLEVVILKDQTKNSTQEPVLPKEETSKDKFKKELKKTLLKRKRQILAIVLWGILLTIGINLWNEYNISVTTPDQVVSIEQSLANEQLVFLAHVNIERLVSLHNYFIDDPDALPGAQSTIFNKLKKSGLDPKKSIQQMLITSYLKDQSLITQSIFLGKFSVQAVQRFFIKHYYGEVIPDPDFVRLRIAELDPDTCEKGNFKEVSIEPERIVISTEGQLDNLHRLLRKAPGNVTDLTDWEPYRSDKLMSMAVFKPEQGHNVTSGLTAMMAQDIIKKNKPLDSLYASIGMQFLPPSGLVDVTLKSQDQSWLEKNYAELTQQVAEMKTSSQGLANLEMLLNKVSIEQQAAGEQGGQISVNLTLDRELKKSIELSLRELTDQFFSMGSASDKSSEKLAVTEKIDAHPVQFLRHYKPSQLKSFNEQLDSFFKPAWIGGAFAVAIDELAIEQDHIVLQLRGKGQNIANVGSQQASLMVTAVNDEQGKNLLAPQKCAVTATSEVGFFTSWGAARTTYVDNKPLATTELEVRQKVKLKQGIKFSQVKSLQGQIELNLATQTQSEQFAKTGQNKILLSYGSRILFKPSAIDTLSYALSGDEKRVLAIRAMNKNKQYLSSASSSSMGSLFGSGRSVTQKFQGEIAFVEVVYAQKLKKITYPVEITKFPPYPADDSWKYELEPSKNSSLKAWNKNYQDIAALEITQENNGHGKQQAVWHRGPFNLSLSNLKTSKHWGTTGQLTIKTPVIDELRHNLSALEVYIHYPQITDTGEVGKSYYYPLKAKGYYMNGEFVLDKDKPYMDGQLSFVLPYKNEQAPLESLNGDIVVHLPLSNHSSSYTDMSIGAQWQDEGVRLKIVRLGNDVMEFEVSDNRSRLLQIVLMDANEQRISTADIQYGLQAHEGNIVVNYHGIPVKALLTVSEGQQTRRYPFQLKLE